ncbi:MAG: gliding motility lipoprotein GldJ [Cyclobacteriaceae bacterium]
MSYISKVSKSTFLLVAPMLLLTSCFLKKGGSPTSISPGSASTTTGLAYNEEEGYQVSDFHGQPDAPNMVYIEGGRTVLGTYEEDLLGKFDNLERTVTVASFYMDETEIANIHWIEYLFYIQRDSSEEFYKSALPDSSVWESALAYNDPYVDHYLRYPGFRYFPTVGITWEQSNDYCAWRTSVVNKKLAEDAGIEVPAGASRIPLETGVVLPAYRLPSEAEWEYAAVAQIGTQWLDENQTHRRLYPWDGHAMRNPYGKDMGSFLANFKRGRGDYAGIAGKLNDGAMITDYIYSHPPNDFGLYNMAGNVNEWVFDVYRPLSFRDFDDLNPIRRNGFLDQQKDDAGGSTRYDVKGFQSLITDNVRVYKGGSWKDVAYWLAPGTRRFLKQDSATAHIGFRCAMIRAGSNY